MRGAVPIEIPVPVSGWMASVPVHKLPATALRDGRNMLINLDSTLSPRPGYANLPAQPSDLPVPDPRLMQLIAFQDTDGVEQIVVASLTQWFALQGQVWVDITGVPFSSDKDTAVRLVTFGSFNNQSALYGINGRIHDDLRVWFVGDPTSQVVTNLGDNGPTSLAADDLDVIADRLVVVNTEETGGGTPGHNPQLVRWSAVIDGQTWPDLARNPLAGIGNLRAVRATSRTAGVVYGDSGAFIMQGVAGDDAGAFVFDRIEGVTVPPISPNALINIAGIHYYIGTDYNIWRCDGQNAQIISGPIQAAIKPGAEATSLAMPVNQRPVVLYDEREQRVWFFVAFQGTEDAFGALPLDLPIASVREGAWGVPQVFHDAVTCAAPVIDQFAPTWDNPGVHAVTALTADITASDTVISVVSTTGFPPLSVDNPVGTLSLPVYDPIFETGELVTYTGMTPTSLTGCTRGAFGTAAAAALSGSTVTCEITWDSANFVWPNWNAISDINEPALYIGTAAGAVARFAKATTDNGTEIAYSARWGLISSPDTTQELQVNAGEVYVVPLEDEHAAEFLVSILTTPYDPDPDTILDHVLFLDHKETWQFRLDATVAIAAFKPGPYFDVQLSGQSDMGGLRYAGASLYADVRKRPDRLNAIGLTGAHAQ